MSAALDVVIPVYNEGDKIAGLLASLAREVKTPIAVFLCHDRDDDDTLPAARAVKGLPFPLVFVKNRGRGPHAAVLSGFSAGKAPAALVLPADHDYNAALIDRMAERFDAGTEVVCACRFMEGGCMVGCPPLKGFLARASAFALHRFAGVPSRDASNGFRLFSRRLLERVAIDSSEGFTYSIELLVKAHRLGLKIEDVPAAWYERRRGQSRFRVLAWLPGYLRWFFYAFATRLGSRSA